jgi:ubiquinone/menaquinone biosynthesis C-methylase UbiE
VKAEMKDLYHCPYSGHRLSLEVREQSGPDVLEGALVAGQRTYNIVDGIPYLISYQDEQLSDEEKREYAYYQASSAEYDRILDWLFESFYENEDRVREIMVDLLNLKPGDSVFESGCGTCRDSTRIARRIGANGTFFLQDLSPNMLAIGRERMRSMASEQPSPALEFFVGNATRLPFPDNHFDAAFHFGGLNLFSDRGLALSEMARIVKPGGKVVVGDESMAPWLRETTYGKILLNSNALYRHEVPIALLPSIARDVRLQWIIGNSFYVIDFVVGDGEMRVDLDKPILGFRGGTHRSRYYGVLDGVNPETKDMAHRAARASGMTLHAWLDQTLRAQAADDIDKVQKL